METNCYVTYHINTKEAIVIDPSDQAIMIEQYLKKNDLVCKAILLTHGHFDHIMAADELANMTGAAIYAHELEEELLANASLNLSSRFGRGYEIKPDVLLKDQEELTLANMNIRIIHTPGHTQGGVCYYFTEYQEMFTGDTLFLESIGRHDFPTGDGPTLIHSVQTKLMTMDEDIIVHPGHGPATTIGHEKQYNPYLR